VHVHPRLGIQHYLLAVYPEERPAGRPITAVAKLLGGLPQVGSSEAWIETRPERLEDRVTMQGASRLECEELDEREGSAARPGFVDDRAITSLDAKPPKQVYANIRASGRLSHDTTSRTVLGGVRQS
jgi:hypothetical protein